jgi:Holliday junction DNA helicase RuvA
MIAFLRGRVLEKLPNRVIIDVGGVGYDVAIPLSTFYATGEPGAEIAVRVHTHVREDQLALYGFATALELTVFERLIAISGIGPKLALAVLSGIEPGEFVSALQRGDVARLTRIPGVGKKTAERIVIELRDRLPTAASAVGGAPLVAGDQMRNDLASALANLGYHQQAIDKVLDRILADGRGRPADPHTGRAARDGRVANAAELTFEDALRAALKDLSRA